MGAGRRNPPRSERAVRGARPPPYALDRASLAREVRIDTYRARGPGGQHVNRTESAVRLVHMPSGVTVTAADTRSQLRNREIAFARLRERLERLNRRPRKRIPTRVPEAVKARRLAEKRERARRKRERKAIPYD
jgi:protein subunit release factor A